MAATRSKDESMDRKRISKLVHRYLAKSADEITDIVLDAVRAHLVGSLQEAKPKPQKKRRKTRKETSLASPSDIKRFNDKRLQKVRNGEQPSHN